MDSCGAAFAGKLPPNVPARFKLNGLGDGTVACTRMYSWLAAGSVTRNDTGSTI